MLPNLTMLDVTIELIGLNCDNFFLAFNQIKSRSQKCCFLLVWGGINYACTQSTRERNSPGKISDIGR